MTNQVIPGLSYDMSAVAQQSAPAPESAAQPQNPYQLEAIDPNDKQFASKTMAGVARAEWDDYKARFLPYEFTLSDIAMGKDGRDHTGEALKLVGGAFDNAKAAQQQGLEMYGVSQQQDVQKANGRGLSLAHAATNAGVQNDVRTANYDRQMDVMAGSNVGQMKSIAGEV